MELGDTLTQTYGLVRKKLARHPFALRTEAEVDTILELENQFLSNKDITDTWSLLSADERSNRMLMERGVAEFKKMAETAVAAKNLRVAAVAAVFIDYIYLDYKIGHAVRMPAHVHRRLDQTYRYVRANFESLMHRAPEDNAELVNARDMIAREFYDAHGELVRPRMRAATLGRAFGNLFGKSA